MKGKFLLEIVFCLLLIKSLCAQCPDRDSLWKRIVFLKDVSAEVISNADQMKELLHYRELLKNCVYRPDSTEALLSQRIAVLYYRAADYVNAIKEIKRSIRIVNENRNSPAINLRQQIRSYYILSLCYSELKEIKGKMAAIDSCVSLSIKLNSVDAFVLYSLGERVEYLFDAGDYKRTHEFAVLGETMAKQSAVTDAAEYLDFFAGWIVNTLIALKDFNTAGNILTDKIELSKRNNQTKNLGTFYEQLAQVQFEMGNIANAELIFQKAYDHNRKTGNRLGCSETLNNLGYYVYFRHYKNFDEAIKVYRRALQHLKTIKRPVADEIFQALNVYANIAYAFVQGGEYDSAFANFQKAFDQIRPGITEQEILQTPWIDSSYKKIRYLVSLFREKAEAYAKRYKEQGQSTDIQEAIRLYKLIDRVLDKVRTGHSEIQSKLFWRSDTRYFYEHAIEACHLAGRWEESFYFFEKSRAVLLNDQLNEQLFLKEEEILSIGQLKKKIQDLDREYEDTHANSGRLSAIEKERFMYKQELDELVNSIKVNNPLYYQSFLDSVSITIPVVRNRLLKDYGALVELFVGDSAVYLFALTANSAHLQKISKIEFESLVNVYTNYLSSPSLQNKNFDQFVNVSSKLYRLLFEGLKLPIGRIIISPDRRYFPFESLVTRSQPLNYLINDYAISYTYSARYLTNNFISPSGTSSKNFMGVAPVQYPAGTQLASLPGSDHSIAALQSYFRSSDKLVASAATKSNFLRQYYNYKIIQLYTHSSDSSGRGEPVIYFADSALYLSDLISEYKPLARLIVLSACETGAGKVYNGEGVFSFNRGFAAIGIPAAITNLWSVENASTYKLTELFYKYLTRGIPSDIALQKAKLEFLKTSTKEKSMPCYWAGAVLVGKADIIEFNESFSWKWMALLAAIGVIIWVGVANRRYFKKTMLKRKKVNGSKTFE